MKSVRVLLGVLLLLGMTSLPIYGQTQQGDILGTIRDSQGSVVPGAQVKIINEDTGAVRQLTSDDRGDYHGIGFFTASYRVEVEKEGFERAVVAGVVVQPITKKRVDVTLQVGAVRAEVTVTAVAPVVETEGPTINATVPKILYDKPMSDISRKGISETRHEALPMAGL